MFPNRVAENGNIVDHTLLLFLSKVREGSFSQSFKKERLFVVNTEGTSHVEGLYWAFLGIFDSKGNLLSKPFISLNIRESAFYLENTGFFSADFVAPSGEFEIYPCEDGRDRIVFIAQKHPNIPEELPFELQVLSFEEGEFKTVQTVVDYIENIEKKFIWDKSTCEFRSL